MAYPQHFQLIVREGRTIGIDLGAVGGVLRLLPLLARQRTVSEPNVTERLLRPADYLRSGVTLSGTRHQPNEDLLDRPRDNLLAVDLDGFLDDAVRVHPK